MNTLQGGSTTHHEYQMKSWQKMIFFILGTAGVAGALFLGYLSMHSAGNPLPVVLTTLLAAFGLYLLASATRSRLILDGSRIELHGAIREQSADLSEIEGYRTVSTRNGKFTKLYLKEGRGTMTMPNSFATDEAFSSWFRRIPDLDQRDRDALLAQISHQQDLGSTPEERLSTLSQAKTTSIFALVVACAAAVAANWGPPILQLPFAAALVLVPVALALLIQRSPLLYAVFKRRSDPRAELSYALIAASFGLLIRARGVHLVSLQSVAWVIGLLALAYVAAFFRSTIESSSPVGSSVALLFFGALFSYGVTTVADTLGDNSRVRSYTVQVTGKHSTTGRSTSYYLELEPWGPVQGPSNLGVSRAVYDQFAAGDEVCLGLHQGRLHAQWYSQIPCYAPSPDFTQ